MNSMQRSDGLDFLDPLARDKPSSVGERLETSCKSEHHALQQTSMRYIGKWMPIQNAFEIRNETQPARNLSQATKEDAGTRHLATRAQVFRIARIADYSFGRNAAQSKPRGSQASRTDHHVSRTRDLFEMGCDFHHRSISLQFGGEAAKPLNVARAKHHAFNERRKAASTAGTYITGCSNDEERRSRGFSPLLYTQSPDALNNQ